MILDQISFSLQKGQKVGLVARNGMGKSTFLQLLMGQLECSSGTIQRSNACRIGFLSQNTTYFQELSVEEYFADHDTQYEDYNERTYQSRLDTILRDMGIYHLLPQSLSSLSGGEQKKVALAKLLIDEPDVLILDEPTNHLDLDMINWLERYLSQKHLTLLMVTHDRYFLEQVCDQIIELDRGALYSYAGNYSDYVFAKAQRREKEQKDIHHLKQLYRRELAWVKKAPRARATKSVKRTKDFFALQDNFKSKLSQHYDDQKTLQLVAADDTPRLGNKILTLKRLSKSFTLPDGSRKVILSDFSCEFRYGERIGIIGNNGVGKTTFLEILIGNLDYDTGRRELADHVEFGYYSQTYQFPPHTKVIDYAKSIADFMIIGGQKIRTPHLLERFLFTPQQQQQWIHDLSGGEQKRLALLTTLMKKPNFLILDEPTNDLDIDTMNALEEFLLSYQGCLIVISHDRYFMDKIATRMFSFVGDGVIDDFDGGYTRYIEWSAKKTPIQTGLPRVSDDDILPEQSVLPPKKSLTKDEKREFEKLMRDITKGEQRKHEINTIFQTQQLSHEELKQLGKELQELAQELEEKEVRWMELSEYA